MSLATLLPSAGWRCLLPAGNLLSQMPLQRRCLVKGGCLVLLFLGNVNLCLLRLLVHFAFCNVCLLQDTVGPLLAWLYKFSGPVTSRKLAATGRLLV